MALLTTPLSTAASSRTHVGTGTDFCALVCAASAGVHGALVVPHLSESIPMAVALAVATVALAAAAVALTLVPRQEVLAAAAVLLVVVAISYLMSRTTGIPGLTEHAERFDLVGTTTSLTEVAAAFAAAATTNPRRYR